jgi:hypothetical protein
MQKMRLLIPLVLSVSCCVRGAEPAKPACNARTQGALWPETGRASGTPIEICSKVRRKYHWHQLTVDASQLKDAPKQKDTPKQKSVIATLATARTPSK